MKLFINLLLTIILLLFVISCNRREIDWDYKDYVQVHIDLDWSGIEDKSELVKVLFYPQNGGKPLEYLIEPDGGDLNLPAGLYDVIIHSWDTRTISFRGLSSYTTLEAYTNLSKQNNTFGRSTVQPIIVAPDELYSWSYNLFEVAKSKSHKKESLSSKSVYPNNIYAQPKNMVFSSSFFIPVIGLEHIVSVQSYITGMGASVFLHDGKILGSPHSILLTATKGKDDNGVSGLWFSYQTFGALTDGELHELYIQITKPDGSTQSNAYDVTLEVNNGDLINITDTIVVDYQSGESGFEEPSIGDWDDETVIVPLD